MTSKRTVRLLQWFAFALAMDIAHSSIVEPTNTTTNTTMSTTATSTTSTTTTTSTPLFSASLCADVINTFYNVTINGSNDSATIESEVLPIVTNFIPDPLDKELKFHIIAAMEHCTQSPTSNTGNESALNCTQWITAFNHILNGCFRTLTPTTTTTNTTTSTTTTSTTVTTSSTSTNRSGSTTTSTTSTTTYLAPPPLCATEVEDAISKGLQNELMRYRILGIDMDCTLSTGEFALHAALRLGHGKAALELIESYKNTSQQFWKTSRLGFTAIQRAAQKGFAECVKFLLKSLNVNISAPDPEGRTPLHLGATVPEITRMLLDAAIGNRLGNIKGKGLNITRYLGTFDDAGDLALHIALRERADDSVKAMLDYSASHAIAKYTTYLASALNAAGDRPVHLCFAYGIFKLLQSHGASFLATNRNGSIPLHTASGASGTSGDGSLNLVAFINVSYNVSINVRDSFGRTPLMYAAAIGDVPNVKWLLARGAQWDLKDDFGEVALNKALKGKFVDLVPLLVGDLEPLRAVIRLGYLDVLQYLVGEGYSVNAQDKNDGRTPIFEAASVNRVDISKFLVGKGARINLLDENGLSPLVVGLAAGSFNTSTYLLSIGAVVMQRVQNYSTALHVASAVKGSHFVIEDLLNRGAIVNAADFRGWTPLHFAASGEIAELLIASGANSTRTLYNGMLPLHTVARAGHADALEKILISRISSINAVTWNGDTALHLAAINQQELSVAELLRFCIDLRLQNSLGHKASEYAVNHGVVQTFARADVVGGRCQCDCPVLGFGPNYRTYDWHGSCEGSVTCRFHTAGVFQVSCARELSPAADYNYTGHWVPEAPSFHCSGVTTSGAYTRTASPFLASEVCFVVAWMAYVIALWNPY